MEIPNDVRKHQYGNFFNRPREWVGSDTTVKIYENAKKTIEPGMFFRSHYAKDVLKAAPEYEVLEFHFHHKSEHTIEGTHYDLEMHIVHVGVGSKAQNKNAFASAMGIIFDTSKGAKVDKATEAAIDGFFESLKLSNSNKSNALNEVKLANMMKYADLQNRWAYKGSLTTPPCTKTVFFNVLRTVWPMKKAHLEQFRTMMLKHGKGAFFQKADGNHRVVQPVNTQNPVIIVNSIGKEKANLRALFIAFLVLFIVSFIALAVVLAICLRARMKNKA